jgi:hypothetical protein
MKGALPMFYGPRNFDAMMSWYRLATAYSRMTVEAAEVIARRTMLIAQGGMSAPEAMGMVMEKATAFVAATEKASVEAARGAHPVRIASAALRPYGSRTRANARKLRR